MPWSRKTFVEAVRSQRQGSTDEQKCLGGSPDLVRNGNITGVGGANVDSFPAVKPPKLARKKSIGNALNFMSNRDSHSHSNSHSRPRATNNECDYYDSPALPSYAKHQQTSDGSTRSRMLRAMRSDAALPRSSPRDSVVVKKQDNNHFFPSSTTAGHGGGLEKEKKPRKLDLGNIFPPQTKSFGRMFKPNRWSQAPALPKMQFHHAENNNNDDDNGDDDFLEATIFVQLKRSNDSAARFETHKTYKLPGGAETVRFSRAKIFEEPEIYGSIKPNVRRPPKGIKHWFEGVDISSDEESETGSQPRPLPPTVAAVEDEDEAVPNPAYFPKRTSSLETSELWNKVRHSSSYGQDQGQGHGQGHEHHRTKAGNERPVSRDPVEDNLMAIEHAKERMSERRRLQEDHRRGGRRGSDDSAVAVDSATSLPASASSSTSQPPPTERKASFLNLGTHNLSMLELSSDEDEEDEYGGGLDEMQRHSFVGGRFEPTLRGVKHDSLAQKGRDTQPTTTRNSSRPSFNQPLLSSGLGVAEMKKSPADRSAEHLDATLRKLSSNDLSSQEESSSRPKQQQETKNAPKNREIVPVAPVPASVAPTPLPGHQMMSVTSEEMALLEMMRHKRATLQTNPFMAGYQTTAWKGARSSSEQQSVEQRYSTASANTSRPKDRGMVGSVFDTNVERPQRDTRRQPETRTFEPKPAASAFSSAQLEGAFPQPPVQSTRPAPPLFVEPKSPPHHPELMNPFSFERSSSTTNRPRPAGTAVVARAATADKTPTSNTKNEDKEKNASWRSLIIRTPGERDSVFPLPPSSASSSTFRPSSNSMIEPKSRHRISASLPPTPESATTSITRGRALSVEREDQDLQHHHPIQRGRPLSTIESSPSPSRSPGRPEPMQASVLLSRTIELAPPSASSSVVTAASIGVAFPLRSDDSLDTSLLDSELDHFPFPTMFTGGERGVGAREGLRRGGGDECGVGGKEQQQDHQQGQPRRQQRFTAKDFISPVSSPPSAVDSAIAVTTSTSSSTCTSATSHSNSNRNSTTTNNNTNSSPPSFLRHHHPRRSAGGGGGGQRLSLLISPTESLASNYHPSHQHAAQAAASAQNFSRATSLHLHRNSNPSPSSPTSASTSNSTSMSTSASNSASTNDTFNAFSSNAASIAAAANRSRRRSAMSKRALPPLPLPIVPIHSADAAFLAARGLTLNKRGSLVATAESKSAEANSASEDVLAAWADLGGVRPSFR